MGDVVGVKAPLGGVAQVIFHGVQVVEVGVQVRCIRTEEKKKTVKDKLKQKGR